MAVYALHVKERCRQGQRLTMGHLTRSAASQGTRSVAPVGLLPIPFIPLSHSLPHSLLTPLELAAD